MNIAFLDKFPTMLLKIVFIRKALKPIAAMLVEISESTNEPSRINRRAMSLQTVIRLRERAGYSLFGRHLLPSATVKRSRTS